MVITMINVLERITELRESHHWTEYQLAEHSGLTQSTISSWYRKQMLPTIPSLVKICDAFGITVSQFFLENEDQAIHLTEKQSALLTASSKLNSEQYNFSLKFFIFFFQFINAYHRFLQGVYHKYPSILCVSFIFMTLL